MGVRQNTPLRRVVDVFPFVSCQRIDESASVDVGLWEIIRVRFQTATFVSRRCAASMIVMVSVLST